MPRPFIDAALLSAHGHSARTPARPTHPVARSLIMADLPDYAFAERLDHVTKPRVCASVAGLARYIESRRRGQGLELVEVDDIEIPGRDGLYRGVQVWTLMLDSGRDRCLGYAWLGGAGRDRLEPALRAARRGADVADKPVAA